MQQYRSNSYLFGGNAPYVEELYEAYLDNPGSVPDNWRAYFDALQNVPAVDGSDSPRRGPRAGGRVVRAARQGQRLRAQGQRDRPGGRAQAGPRPVADRRLPLPRLALGRPRPAEAPAERPKIPELEPAFYDLTEADMDITFSATNTYFTTAEQMTLREIVQALRETYCGTIGAEFMHITDPAEKRWWQERLESIRCKPNFSAEEKKHILDRLTAAEGLERYLHTKYVGQKRFSLEGGESFIASMDELVQRAGETGVQEIVIGMAHRGRLNVLVNTLGKMPKDLFAEFDAHRARGPAGRRRQVPPGLLERRHDAGRPGAPEPGVQPVAPRDRQPGGRRLGQGAPGPPRRQRRRHGAAGAGARRRRLRRPGRGDGDAGAGADPRLLHRRHGAHRHQQPDRLHHQRPARLALDAVLHRRRQDDRGAGAARERRRPRGGGAVHASSRSTTARSSTRTSWSTSSASASSATTSRTRRR